MEALKSNFTLVDEGEWKNKDGRPFSGPFGTCYDYNKNCNASGREVTGYGMYVNRSQYAIVDVDIHCDQPEEVSELFIDAVYDLKVKIVQTRGKGLHIYSKWDKSLDPKSGRSQGFYTNMEKNYQLDLFTPVNPTSTSVIMMPGSVADDKEGKNRGEYKWIDKCPDADLSNLADVVNALEEAGLVNFDAVRPGGKLAAEHKVSLKKSIKPQDDDYEAAGAAFVSDEQSEAMDVHDACTKELFELLKAGIETMGREIHKDRKPIEEEPTLWSLFKGAYGCVGDEVSEEEVDDWLDDFRDQHEELLTGSSRKAWSTERKRYRKEDNKGPGMLVSIVKYHNKEFYDSKLKPYYAAHLKKQPAVYENATQAFEKSSTTLSEYLRTAGNFTSVSKHQEMLREFIAIKPGGFIVKEAVGDSFRYHERSNKEIVDYLDVYYNIDYEVEVVDKKTQEKRTETKTLTYKPMLTLKDGQFRTNNMAFYNTTELMSNKPGVLSRYVPPKCEPNNERVERFIKFFESRVSNPEALHDELTAHAYRFRHPATRCGKVYWHHSTNAGDTGKTLLASVIAGMYPDLSMVCSDKSAQSDFNSFLFDYLNLNFEELENENYRNDFFATFIKRASGRNGQKRRMYHDYETAEYKCIVSVNTNSADCYGVVRADRPALERCVVIEFKPNDGIKWDEVRDEFGINDRKADYENTFSNFCGQLQHYLQYDYVNPYCPNMENWNPQRDKSEAKWKLVSNMRKQSERLPMRFIKCLCTPDEFKTGTGESQYPIVQLKEGKRIGAFAFISNSDLQNSFASYVNALPASNREKKMYTVGSVKEELENCLHWEEKRMNSARGYMLTREAYFTWRDSLASEIEEIELEDAEVEEINDEVSDL